MIPFDIASFQEDSLSNLRTTLPRNITVDGRMYGYTLYKEGASHFTAAVMWRNKWWVYDGLSETDQTRMTPMRTQRFLCDISIILVIHHACIHVCYLLCDHYINS